MNSKCFYSERDPGILHNILENRQVNIENITDDAIEEFIEDNIEKYYKPVEV